MSSETPDVVIDRLAEAKADFTLSLHRVLTGCMNRVGGPDRLGEIIGDMILDDNGTPVNVRANAISNVMKLLASHGESESGGGLLDEEQIEARLKQIERAK